jgi:hypothetical protein
MPKEAALLFNGINPLGHLTKFFFATHFAALQLR